MRPLLFFAADTYRVAPQVPRMPIRIGPAPKAPLPARPGAAAPGGHADAGFRHPGTAASA